MRRVKQSTLDRKLRLWQRMLKLSDWDMSIGFKDFSAEDVDSDLATVSQLEYCSPVERTAIVRMATDFWTREGYGVSFNLDTLILHELIHVILWEQSERLPPEFRDSSVGEEFEEFICFHFSKLIYDMRKQKGAKNAELRPYRGKARGLRGQEGR